MQILHGPTGQTFEFPDGTDDNTIAQSFEAGNQAIAPQYSSLAQQLMQGFQQAPQPSSVPAPNGRGMIGLTPQQAQFTLQQHQNSQALEQQKMVEQQRAQFRNRELMAREQESEKDRQQQIKLTTQKFKNDLAVQKLEEEAAKAKYKLDHIDDLRKENIQQQQFTVEADLAERKLQQQIKKDESSLEVAKRRADIAASRIGAGGKSPTPRLITTTENGQTVQKWVLPKEGESYPVAEKTSGTGSGGDDDITAYQRGNATVDAYERLFEATKDSGNPLPEDALIAQAKKFVDATYGMDPVKVKALQDDLSSALSQGYVAEIVGDKVIAYYPTDQTAPPPPVSGAAP